jgi:hypothetical protein
MTDDIAALEDQRDAKFEEILDVIASDLKLGKFDTLSAEDQARVEQEAEAASDRWIDEVEDEPREPNTPLEKLLAEHYAIMLKIPDDDEDYEDDDDEDDDNNDNENDKNRK